ncbi:MAG: division/cell wall cluster transcriptional repressor MraZ [Actinomycetota bacterium]
MYFGAYRHALDAKGRVFLPAKFRAKLAGGVMVAPWASRHLVILDKDEWPSFVEQLAAARREGKLSSSQELVITSEASDEEPDAQGRITLPQRLRQFAEVDKEVWFLGRGKRIEIVAAEAWDAQRDLGLGELAAQADMPV